MRADLLTLNSPGVRAAKARWDRAHQRRKHRLSFNYLLSCFKEDRVRFSEIAMASGLSIERILASIGDIIDLASRPQHPTFIVVLQREHSGVLASSWDLGSL